MSVTVLSDLARNIRKFRTERRLTVTGLAEKSEISKGLLSSIENGKTPNPGIQTVLNIAHALSINVNQITSRRTITSYKRGHLCWYDQNVWRYMDDDTEFDDSRQCPKCDRLPTKDSYDVCIGKLPGAISVCCGHGIEDGYIVWGDDDS